MRNVGHAWTWKRAGLIWGSLALILAWSPRTEAQQPSDALPTGAGNGISAGSGLVVNSQPPGAVVVLRGPYEWVGVTPWRLSRQVSGLYRVEARRPGYETYNSEVVLGAEGWQELNLKLSRKTKEKAFFRSIIIPGWGQVYRGSKTKGFLVFAGTVLAGTALAITDADYSSALDDYQAAQRRYERATRLEDLSDRWSEVVAASHHADTKWDRRRLALGALGGIYAFNLLDVLFFAPGGDAEPGISSNLAPTAPADRGLACTAALQPQGTVQASLRWNW